MAGQKIPSPLASGRGLKLHFNPICRHIESVVNSPIDVGVFSRMRIRSNFLY